MVESRKNEDARFLAAYTLREAAHYLRLPRTTLRFWAVGWTYPTLRGTKTAHPIIELPELHPPTLSFINLVEAHVLAAITRKYDIPLQKVRAAVRFLKKETGSRYPLATEVMETDAKDLFIRKSGLLINVTQEGQTAIRQVLEVYLSRIEHADDGFATRLYPFTHASDLEGPLAVMIDPRFSFGRPVLAGTNIPTAIIAERYKAGDSIQGLAGDYRREAEEIEEAIRCELELPAA
jgi:uncharacterized protein (DUF433 family)